MSNDSRRQCGECGDAVEGAFCSSCGTRTGFLPQTPPAGGGVHDEPTRHPGGGARPFPGYVPAPAVADDGAPAATGGRLADRANQVLVALIALTALAVAALTGYLLTRGGPQRQADVPAVSDSSDPVTSTAPAPSSASGTSTASTATGAASTPPSAQSSGAAPTQAPTQPPAPAPAPAQTTPRAPQETTAPTAPATTQEPPRETQPTQQGIDALSGVEAVTSVGGSRFAVTRNGNTASVYVGDDSSAHSLGSVTLYGGGGQRLEMLTLPGCSHPIVLWNAAGDTGSAAYGFDGSGYQSYAGTEAGELTPSGGTGRPAAAYGVNMLPDGSLEVRNSAAQKARGSGNHFDRCVGSGPADVLNWANPS